AHGTSVSMGAAGAAGGGGVVDSAALDAYADTVTGENGVLATAARQVLSQLGLVEEAPETPETDNTLFETVEAELGSGWEKTVTPSFDAKRALLFDDRWASAREDLARVALGEIELPAERFLGTGETSPSRRNGGLITLLLQLVHMQRPPLLQPCRKLLPPHAKNSTANSLAMSHSLPVPLQARLQPLWLSDCSKVAQPSS